jgi:hypothetical protein
MGLHWYLVATLVALIVWMLANAYETMHTRERLDRLEELITQ